MANETRQTHGPAESARAQPHALSCVARRAARGPVRSHTMPPASSVVLLACLALAGCAHYEPRPLSAASVQRSFAQRTLDAPALQSYLQQHLHRPAPPWDLEALTLAAWYDSPELDKARAQYQARAAAEITAGRSPPATLGVPFEYNTTPKAGESPYTLGLALDIPIEMAGKRGDRLGKARALSLAARFDIGATAWRIRQRLRADLLAYWDAQARGQLLQAQVAAREHLSRLLERRRDLGEASTPELLLARAQAASDRAKLLQTRREAADALAATAGVIGIPAGALVAQPLDLHEFDSPPPEPARGALLDAAVRNRADVQAQLARYDASQSALQLAIADQYPDVHIGPGYTFDAGAHKLVFNLTGMAVALPHANRGPIAEARAQRRVAASQVEATVAAATSDVDRAFAAWRPAAQALASAQAQVRDEERLVQAAAEGLRSGEGDRPALLRAQIDAGAARLDAQQALLQLQQAAGALEDAVQRPVLGEPAVSPSRGS
jgi:outer membrane protein, heavy metal efflux system